LLLYLPGLALLLCRKFYRRGNVVLQDIFTSVMNNLGSLARADTAVGNPMTINGLTIIPLFSISLGMGNGTFSTGKTISAGSGGGLGASITPMALVVLKDEDVQVYRLGSGMMESLSAQLPEIIAKAHPEPH
jgi:uncharacterized spore protein YtfJ